MAQRTVEDHLRHEYFQLLPHIQRLLLELETIVRHSLLRVLRSLEPYEQVVIRGRRKECESAIEALRRRIEGRTFDQSEPDRYTLLDLPDLAGVRVLVFPTHRSREVNGVLRKRFAGWRSDPIRDGRGRLLASKYTGFLGKHRSVRGEVQIVSMLTGLFWEVEHSALYKPTPQLRRVGESLKMRERNDRVIEALTEFETEFQQQVKRLAIQDKRLRRPSC